MTKEGEQSSRGAWFGRVTTAVWNANAGGGVHSKIRSCMHRDPAPQGSLGQVAAWGTSGGDTAVAKAQMVAAVAAVAAAVAVVMCGDVW